MNIEYVYVLRVLLLIIFVLHSSYVRSAIVLKFPFFSFLCHISKTFAKYKFFIDPAVYLYSPASSRHPHQNHVFLYTRIFSSWNFQLEN